MPVLLGLDIGTTSTEGILIDTDGDTLATLSRPSELISLHANWAEEDPELVVSNVVAITRELLERRRLSGRGRGDRRQRNGSRSHPARPQRACSSGAACSRTMLAPSTRSKPCGAVSTSSLLRADRPAALISN